MSTVLRSTRQVSIPAGAGQTPVSPIQLGSVTIPRETITEMVVTRKLWEHDTIEFKTSTPLRDTASLKGQEAKLRIYDKEQGGSSVGFTTSVLSVKKDQPYQAASSVSMTLIGGTYKARKFNQRILINKTIEQLASLFLVGNQLSVSFGNSSNFVFPRMAQTTESDWGSFIKAASFLGLGVSVNGTSVTVFDPVQRLKSVATPVVLRKATSEEDREALLSFDVTDLDLDLVDSPDRRGFFDAQGSPQVAFPTESGVATDMFIPNGNVARQLERSFKVATSTWTQSAVARIRGRSGISPGMVVDIHTGLKSSSVDRNDGLWLVVDVVHNLTTSAFQSSLRLVRDTARFSTSSMFAPSLAQPGAGRLIQR